MPPGLATQFHSALEAFFFDILKETPFVTGTAEGPWAKSDDNYLQEMSHHFPRRRLSRYQRGSLKSQA